MATKELIIIATIVGYLLPAAQRLDGYQGYNIVTDPTSTTSGRSWTCLADVLQQTMGVIKLTSKKAIKIECEKLSNLLSTCAFAEKQLQYFQQSYYLICTGGKTGKAVLRTGDDGEEISDVDLVGTNTFNCSRDREVIIMKTLEDKYLSKNKPAVKLACEMLYGYLLLCKGAIPEPYYSLEKLAHEYNCRSRMALEWQENDDRIRNRWQPEV